MAVISRVKFQISGVVGSLGENLNFLVQWNLMFKQILVTKPKKSSSSQSQGGYFHIRSQGDLAPNFASKNINDEYPKFCPLNFRYDPKIGTFSQLLCLLVTELPKFSSYFVNLAGPCPKFCLQT